VQSLKVFFFCNKGHFFLAFVGSFCLAVWSSLFVVAVEPRLFEENKALSLFSLFFFPFLRKDFFLVRQCFAVADYSSFAFLFFTLRVVLASITQMLIFLATFLQALV
jgi:hypothetical protein